jgi:hypothetical protein
MDHVLAFDNLLRVIRGELKSQLYPVSLFNALQSVIVRAGVQSLSIESLTELRVGAAGALGRTLQAYSGGALRCAGGPWRL